MISRLRAIIARKSISGSGTITPSARASRTSWAASLVARSVLLGMQPRKMHSPPSGPGSTKATEAPSERADDDQIIVGLADLAIPRRDPQRHLPPQWRNRNGFAPKRWILSMNRTVPVREWMQIECVFA